MHILLDLAREYGLVPEKKSSTRGGEYASCCPKCGGEDRFIMWPSKKMSKVEGCYWCRRCESRGDSIQFGIDFLGMEYKEAVKRCGVKESKFTNRSVYTYKPFENDFRANEKWCIEMKNLIVQASNEIFNHEDIVKQLNERGLNNDVIKKYNIGYLAENVSLSREKVGLLKDEGNKSIWIPNGILIPTFEKEKVVRLKVRRSNWEEKDKMPKYVAVTGSREGMNLIGNIDAETIVVLESELDAYVVHWLLKDKALVVAVGGNSKTPDSLTHDRIKKAKKVLVICDNDEGGKTMREKWSVYYSHAEFTSVPEGKDIGEAFERGFNVKQWIHEILPVISHLAPSHLPVASEL